MIETIENASDDVVLGDERNDAKLAAAVAAKRIGLMNALDELSPSFPERGALFWG